MSLRVCLCGSVFVYASLWMSVSLSMSMCVCAHMCQKVPRFWRRFKFSEADPEGADFRILVDVSWPRTRRSGGKGTLRKEKGRWKDSKRNRGLIVNRRALQ